MPLKLGEGHRGVQFLPAELGEVKLKLGFTWLLGVKPGEKLKELLLLDIFWEPLELMECLLEEWSY